MIILEHIYVVGGQQKGEIYDEWQQFKMGVILKINLTNQRIERSLEYISPSNFCPANNPSILFKAGTIYNDQFYLCTQTEVLIYTFPGFKEVKHISLPCFNDLHHVRPTVNGDLLIANTGLDMVLKINQSGDILQTWNVLQQNPWDRFSENIDYRKFLTTKPHQSHPNFVFELNDEVWATRCLQKDAVCLTDPTKKIDIGGSYVHDGIVFKENIYFTRVDGNVVVVNKHDHNKKSIFDLKEISQPEKSFKSLGWCRGIHIIDDYKVIVGFSRLRPTQSKDKNGKSILKGGYGALPTRIVYYDLKESKIIWEIPVEDYNLNSIFSVHA